MRFTTKLVASMPNVVVVLLLLMMLFHAIHHLQHAPANIAYCH